MILESNIEIEQLVSHLNKNVVQLRNIYPNSQFLKIVKSFYDTVVIPWSDDYYLYNVETDSTSDTEIKNQILDMINLITDVLHKQISTDKQ